MNQRIAFFEFGLLGHSAIYIKSFIEAFKKRQFNSELCIWVPGEFITTHIDLCRPYLDTNAKIHFMAIEKIIPNLFMINQNKLEVIRKCLAFKPAEVTFLSLNLDSCIRGITFSKLWEIDTQFVGILGKPHIHYIKFKSKNTKKWLKFNRWIKQYLLLFLFIHRPDVSCVFLHDPMALDFFKHWLLSKKFQHIPEYYLEAETTSNPKKQFSLPNDRHIFSLIGALTEFKGTCLFLKGVFNALENSTFHENACVVLGGNLDVKIRSEVLILLKKIREKYPDFPIYLIDRRLSDLEFTSLVDASDVICLPYAIYPASSGMLIQALSQGKLICATDFGIVGELINHYELGITFERRNPSDLATVLISCLELSRIDNSRDSEKRKKFAAEHSISLDEFGQRLCNATIMTLENLKK